MSFILSNCNLLAESHMHLFFICHKSVACWNLIGVDNIIRELLLSAENFQKLLFDFLSRLTDQKKHLAAMILWSLWKSHNLLLWENSDTAPIHIVNHAQEVLHEWNRMQKIRNPPQHEEQLHIWTKPQQGWIKCNVDAAIFNGNMIMGYGICFRNSTGNFLLGKSDYNYSSTTVLEAEAIGLLESIKLAISKAFHHVVFETDNKILVDLLKSTTPPINEIGDLVSDCKTLLLSNSNYVVLFVRRQANKVAHNIARAALSHPSLHVFSDVPTSLYSLILNEMQ